MSIVSVQEILNYINRKEFEPLLKVDQLNLEREKNKVFLRFGEYACFYQTVFLSVFQCCSPPLPVHNGIDIASVSKIKHLSVLCRKQLLTNTVNVSNQVAKRSL